MVRGTVFGLNLLNLLTPDQMLGLAVGYAALLVLVFGWSLRNYLNLPALRVPPKGAPEPDCMVVIPARNEEEHIGKAVRSLPPDSVIVVNDGSTDRTAEEAEAAGAGVLPAPKRPRGSLGKSNACMAGAAPLQSKWILFADADTWFEPGFLTAAVAAAEQSGVDYLSIELPYEARGIAEHLLVPYLAGLYHAGASPLAYGMGHLTGQCLLVRRSSYEFVGGHRAVMEFLSEDIRLGEIALRHRMPVGGVRAGSLGHARLQEGFNGLWDGLPRNAFRLSHLGMFAAPAVILAAILTSLSLPLALWMFLAGQTEPAAIALLAPVPCFFPWYRNLWAITAPVAILVGIPILIRAGLGAAGAVGIEWKGRRV